MKHSILFITFMLVMLPIKAFAYDLDLSVDDDIRKNYNPSAIEDTLPKLPTIDNATTNYKPNTYISTPSNNSNVPKSVLNESINTSTASPRVKTIPSQSNYKINDNSTAIKLKKGTKFKVKSLTNIYDTNTAGARMSFKTEETVTQRYITVPSGSIIKGVIIDSHSPQMSGNGGLIVVKADSITLGGFSKSIDGKIIKANNKKIFFNNIKGKRKYLSNIPKYAKKGKPFYVKMMKTSSNLSNNGATWILTPFTVISGVVVYGATIITSPVSALFSKGEHVNVPAGSEYIIKLRENSYIE